MCVHKTDYTEEFDLPRGDFKEAVDYGQGNFALHILQKAPEIGAGGFHHALFVHNIEPSHRWLAFRRASQVMTEANVAGKVAGPWLLAIFNNFSDAEKKFLAATAGLPLPLTAEQADKIRLTIAAADDSEKSGNLQAAFDLDLASLAGLPPNAAGPEVDSLHQRILDLAPKLNPRPAIPDEAQRYFFGSQAALQEWKDKGDPAKLDDAIEQLNEALRIAPWWPEAYFNRGLVLEDRGRYAEAVDSLKLYLLAAPNASDATQVKQKIYMLEYKAKEAQTQK